LGHFLDRPLGNLARAIPFHPNTLTVAGFVLTAAASLVLVSNLALGGLLVIIGGLFDVFDGVVARVNAKQTRFGAFLDSVLDRFSDAFILLAVGLNLFRHGNITGLALCVLTLISSFLVSYVRARAEGLGKNCREGLMERPERILLLSLGAITGFMVPILWILLILTQFTVFQRMYHVWKIMGRE
jgi:phosphatidylglycerophosphate synthase